MDEPDDRWLTMTDAAQRLRVSYRTVQRWVSAGKVETRRTADGRHLVRMTGPDTDTTTERQQGLAAASMALARQAQVQAEVIIANAEQRVSDAQRRGTAWAVGLMLTLSAAGVGGWLVSGQLAGQRVELEVNSATLASFQTDLAAAVGERDQIAVELGQARHELAASAGAWLLFGDQLDAVAARALDEPWQGVLASPGP